MAPTRDDEALFDASFLRTLQALDEAMARFRAKAGEGIARQGLARGLTEFRGHRPYSQGDDLRRLDWNAYGRLGRLYLREFEPEHTEHVTLLVDRSRSMAAGSPPKHLHARRIAAAYGYLALQHGGGATVTGYASVEGQSRLGRLLEILAAENPDRDESLARRLADLSARAAPSDLVVVTDGLEPPENFAPLANLSRRRTAVTLVLVLAPDELAPPRRGEVRLHGLEEGDTLPLQLDDRLAAAYERELEKHLETLQGLARAHGWALALTSSADPLLDLFLGRLRPAGRTP